MVQLLPKKIEVRPLYGSGMDCESLPLPKTIYPCNSESKKTPWAR